MNKVDKQELHNLFKEISVGNEEGYNKLYKKYNKIVYAIAYSILKNEQESEDIVQKIFFKIWKLEKEKLPKNNEASWLYSVTKNEALNFLKSRKDEINIEEVYYISNEDVELSNIVEKEYFNKIIKKLNIEEREIVSLKILSNLSFEEISMMLGKPNSTIKWKYYKAVGKLKALLEQLGFIIVGVIISSKILVDYQEINRNEVIEKEPIENVKVNENEKVDDVFENELITENTIQVQQVSENTKQYNIEKTYSIFILFITFIIIYIFFFKNTNQKLKRKCLNNRK